MVRSLAITTLLVFVSFLNYLYTQDCEPNLYFFPFDGASIYQGASIDSTQEGEYISLPYYYSDGGANGKDIAVLKSDAFGNEIWTNTYGWEGDETASVIKRLPDGNFIIAGTTESASQTTEERSILLLKIDGNGNLLWHSVLNEAYGSKYDIKDIELAEDNGFVIVGTSIATTYSTPLGMAMFKTDSEGNLLNQRLVSPWVINTVYGGIYEPSITQGGDVFITANGDYIFSGLSIPATIVGPIDGYLTLVRTNSNLDIIWESTRPYGLCYPPLPRGGIEYEDGSLYITYTSVWGGCFDAGTSSKLVKYSENGEYLWSVSMGGGYTGDIIMTADGNFVLSRGNGIVKRDTSGALMWESPRINNFINAESNALIDDPQSNGYMLIGGIGQSVVHAIFDSLGNHCTSTISGSVFVDADQDCEIDSTEVLLENEILELNSLNTFTDTDVNGMFLFQVDTGNYNLQLHPPNALWEIGCPLLGSYDIYFDEPYQIANQRNFGLHALEDCALLNVDIGLPRGRVCTEQLISVQYCNEGTIAESEVVVEVQLDEEIGFLDASFPWVQNGDIYHFDIGELDIGECGQFFITVMVSCDGQIGDTICVSANIYPENTCVLEEGQDSDISCRVLTNSFDPNDKIADAANTSSCWETALDEIAFTVRFQNTGNDTAYRVVIIDTLSSDLDISTVRPGPSSHPYEFKLSGENHLMFVFNDINLLDSTASVVESQGFVQFFVYPKVEIVDGTLIENQAAIYFDTNEPIITSPVYIPQCEEIPLTVVDVDEQIITDCLSPNGSLAIHAKGGNGNYLYSVNAGQDWSSDSVFTNLPIGEYEVWVKDGADNITHYHGNPIQLEKAIPIILDITTINPGLCDSSDGQITVNAYSEGDIMFSIDGGESYQASFVFDSLPEGTYQILAYDACLDGEISDSIFLTDPAYPEITGIITSDPACGDNGSIRITATGAFYYKSYSVDGGETWQPSRFFYNLPAGDYQVMVSYEEGSCAIALDSIITLVDTMTVPHILGVGTSPPTHCDSLNGMAQVFASGTALEYSIDGGMNFQEAAIFLNVNPGEYTIIARNDCEIQDTSYNIVVPEPPVPVLINVSTIDPNCGLSNGAISLSAVGGGNIYCTINNWEEEQADTTFETLPAGIYTIGIRNDYFCYANSVSVELISPLPPVITELIIDEPNCIDSLAGIIVNAESTESLLYSVDWGQSWQDSAVFVDLLPGIYGVVVSNASLSCQDSLEEFQLIPTPFPVIDSVSVIPPSNSMAEDGSLKIFSDGILYSIDEGLNWQASPIFDFLEAGVYYPWVSWQDTSCISIGDKIVLSPISNVNDLDDDIQTLSIYPNPTNQFVNLDIKLQQPLEVRWWLTTISGKIVKKCKEPLITNHLKEQITIDHLPEGVYVIRLEVGIDLYNKIIVVY